MYDAAEHLVPVVLAILRAESLSEVPVIGRMIAASERRAHAAGDSPDADRRESGHHCSPWRTPVTERDELDPRTAPALAPHSSER